MEQKPLPPLDSIHIAKQVPDDLKIDATKFYDALHAEVGLTPPENGYPHESQQVSSTEMPEVPNQPATADENPYHSQPKSLLKSGLLEGHADAKLLEEFASRSTYRLPELTEITQRLEESSLYSADEKEQLHSLLLDKIDKETSRLSIEQVVTLLDSGSLDAGSARLITSALQRKISSIIKMDSSTNPTPVAPDFNITDLQEAPADVTPQSPVQLQVLPEIHPSDDWHNDVIASDAGDPEANDGAEKPTPGQKISQIVIQHGNNIHAIMEDDPALDELQEQTNEIIHILQTTTSETNPLEMLTEGEALQAIVLLQEFLTSEYVTPEGRSFSDAEAAVITEELLRRAKGNVSRAPTDTEQSDHTVDATHVISADDDIEDGSFSADTSEVDEEEELAATYIPNTTSTILGQQDDDEDLDIDPSTFVPSSDKAVPTQTIQQSVESEPATNVPKNIERNVGSIAVRRKIFNPITITKWKTGWAEGQEEAKTNTNMTFAKKVGVKIGKSWLNSTPTYSFTDEEAAALAKYEKEQETLQLEKYQREINATKAKKPEAKSKNTDSNTTEANKPSSPSEDENTDEITPTVNMSDTASGPLSQVESFLASLDKEERESVEKLPYSTIVKLASKSK